MDQYFRQLQAQMENATDELRFVQYGSLAIVLLISFAWWGLAAYVAKALVRWLNSKTALNEQRPQPQTPSSEQLKEQLAERLSRLR